MTRASIRTRYHGPTQTQGTRISVTAGPNPFCKSPKLFVSWDHSLDIDANHNIAAQEYLDKFMSEYGTPIKKDSVSFDGDRFHSWQFVEGKS